MMIDKRGLRLRGFIALAMLSTGSPVVASAVCLPPTHASVAYSTEEDGAALVPAEIDPLDIDETKAASSSTATTTRTVEVPTRFHVITNGTPATDVSNEVLETQLQVLNDSFSGASGGAQSPFRFTLAGVTRTIDVLWHHMGAGSPEERAAKASLRAGGPNTLNVYIVQPSQPVGVLGWGTFPWWYASDPSYDGVVVHRQTMPDGALMDWNSGEVTVHEVGHWLGLYHTFEDFGTGDGCTQGDFVKDTPAEQSPARGCPEGRDTCPANGLDPIHNFMDYTNGECVSEFTVGQTKRMSQKWAHYRKAKGQ